jgi:hypothetical protein
VQQQLLLHVHGARLALAQAAAARMRLVRLLQALAAAQADMLCVCRHWPVVQRWGGVAWYLVLVLLLVALQLLTQPTSGSRVLTIR